jgi:ADP-heptose:LPS heptosyltransferase
VSQLDLVISVDTSVAHLSGALGKPTWILLPFAVDFRWLSNRSDTPWYPTAQLFRQPRFGDWEGAVEQLRQRLSSL